MHGWGVCHDGAGPVDLLARKLPEAEVQLECMWAVSEFTEANGGTRFCPGSHLWPAGRVPRADEIVAAEVPRGSVLLWLGSTLHGSGASVPGTNRQGLLLGYCLSWLRPEQNMHFTCPADVAAAMDDRMAVRIPTKRLGETVLNF
eukprot:COSAG06_NODE_1181_length_10363_cov_10.391563_7_plen_145_part_00